MAAGTLKPADSVGALRPASASAVFAWDDPLPALFDLPLVAVRVARRRLARGGGDLAAAPLSSSAAPLRSPGRTTPASPR
jgi:hypothetical protein